MSIPDRPTLRRIVALACQAPSVHNTQPWRWVADRDELRLYSDSRRKLTYADPAGRDLVMSCGAALHQLAVAAAANGWATEVRRLPEPQDPTLLARIGFSEREATPDDVRRATAMAARRTDRRQVSSWPVPSGRVEELLRLAREHGCMATPIDDGAKERLTEELVAAAQLEQHRNDAYLDELLGWTHTLGEQGVPTTNLLTRQAAAKPGALTRFPSGSLPDEYSEDASPNSAWVVISTSSDDELSCLRAGEALAAVWLACTEAGLSLVPYTQPTEVHGTRVWLQREILHDMSCPQALLRIGWPPLQQLPVHGTPRLPVDEVLEFAEAQEMP